MAIINNMPSGSSGKKYASGNNLSLRELKKVTTIANTYNYDWLCIPANKVGFVPSVFRILVQYRTGGSFPSRYLRSVIGNYYTSSSTTDIIYAQKDGSSYPTSITSSPYKMSIPNYTGEDLPVVEYSEDIVELKVIKWEAWE